IPHYVLDYESRFRDSVIDDFADSYLRGETPVPCIRCNQEVKFHDLLAMARQLGANALATGHYIRSAQMENGHYAMYTPEDMARDQSYFLFTTSQEQLDYLRFPLAGMKKSEVRELAGEFGLDIASKPDSQDICFVPEGDYASVISKLRPEAVAPGEIVHVDGRALGRHDGIMKFTIGQRRGLGVATGEPLFVVALRPDTREVVVGPRKALAAREMLLREVNWLGPENAHEGGFDCYVKIRSTRPAEPATLYRSEDENTGARVVLHNDDYGVSPGQACVFYEKPGAGARVFGGGWISHVTGAAEKISAKTTLFEVNFASPAGKKLTV
ncbi:MAG: tRNA 2-thiouridine(34) synthase MnmA, partial [Hyphomicrobiales bacterium]